MSGYKIYAKIGTIMKWHKYEHENRNYHFVQMTSFLFPLSMKMLFHISKGDTTWPQCLPLNAVSSQSGLSRPKPLRRCLSVYHPAVLQSQSHSIWSASVLPVVCVVISYEGIAIFVFAVQDDHQRMVLHSLVAPLVCVLKPWLEEVETGSEAGQHQDRHQQVDGDEPVQEHPGHGTVTERYRRRETLDCELMMKYQTQSTYCTHGAALPVNILHTISSQILCASICPIKIAYSMVLCVKVY